MKRSSKSLETDTLGRRVLTRYFPVLLIITIIGFVAIFVLMINHTNKTDDDREVRLFMYDVNRAIDDYRIQECKSPDSLEDLDIESTTDNYEVVDDVTIRYIGYDLKYNRVSDLEHTLEMTRKSDSEKYILYESDGVGRDCTD